METKKKLREERINAEERALTHYRKLNKIEKILMIGRAERTPAVFIVDQINEVINSK
jgi:hypothetical protein